MVWLIGGFAGLVWFYFWLSGHWFARVVGFVPVAFAFGAAALAFDIPTLFRVVALAGAVGFAWLLASAPRYLKGSAARPVYRAPVKTSAQPAPAAAFRPTHSVRPGMRSPEMRIEPPRLAHPGSTAVR